MPARISSCFPSETEVSAECGAGEGERFAGTGRGDHGGGQFVVEAGRLRCRGQDPARWAEAIRPLLEDEGSRRAMAANLAALDATSWPSWLDVLREDLLPVWRAVPKSALEFQARGARSASQISRPGKPPARGRASPAKR